MEECAQKAAGRDRQQWRVDDANEGAVAEWMDSGVGWSTPRAGGCSAGEPATGEVMEQSEAPEVEATFRGVGAQPVAAEPAPVEEEEPWVNPESDDPSGTGSMKSLSTWEPVRSRPSPVWNPPCVRDREAR